MVARSDLMAALAQNSPDAPVSQIMRRDFQVIDVFDMLEAAVSRLQTCQCRTMLAVHNGRLVGLLTLDRVREILALQSTIQPSGAHT